MAKGKPVTAEEIREAMAIIDDGVQRLIGMEIRISNGHLGDVPDAFEIGRSLVASSRTFNEFALRMFISEDLLRMKSQTAAMVRRQAGENESR